MHAEEFRPGGEVLRGDSPAVAVRYAEVFARLMAELADVAAASPLPNPRWVRRYPAWARYRLRAAE